MNIVRLFSNKLQRLSNKNYINFLFEMIIVIKKMVYQVNSTVEMVKRGYREGNGANSQFCNAADENTNKVSLV